MYPAASPQASPEIYLRLTEILRDVFDNDDITASPELTAAHVEGWDSLANVRLFVSIEQSFGVRFNTGEISALKTVGALALLIEQKSRSSRPPAP